MNVTSDNKPQMLRIMAGTQEAGGKCKPLFLLLSLLGAHTLHAQKLWIKLWETTLLGEELSPKWNRSRGYRVYMWKSCSLDKIPGQVGKVQIAAVHVCVCDLL